MKKYTKGLILEPDFDEKHAFTAHIDRELNYQNGGCEYWYGMIEINSDSKSEAKRLRKIILKALKAEDSK